MLRIFYFIIYIVHFIIYILYFILYTSLFLFYILYIIFYIHILHFIFYISHFLGLVHEVSPFRPRGPPGAGVGTTIRLDKFRFGLFSFFLLHSTLYFNFYSILLCIILSFYFFYFLLIHLYSSLIISLPIFFSTTPSPFFLLFPLTYSPFPLLFVPICFSFFFHLLLFTPCHFILSHLIPFLFLLLSLLLSFSSDATSDFTSFLPSVSVGGPSPFVGLELGGLMPSEDSKANW